MSTYSTITDYSLTADRYIDYSNNFVFISSPVENLDMINSVDIFESYSQDDLTDIENFLRKNPSIKEYVTKAPVEIKKYFENPKLNLEVVIDPEIENDEGILFVNIVIADRDVNKTWSKLNDLTKNWLVPVVGANVAKFNVDIQFA